jgi:hypothetical protein
VINPGKVKQLVDLPSAIDKWESSVRRLSSDFNIKILDDPNCDVIKIGILAEMLPVGVSEVLTQKLCDDVKSYKEAKDVIARFMAFKDDTGPAPWIAATSMGTLGMRGRSLRNLQKTRTSRNCMLSRRARVRARGRVGAGHAGTPTTMHMHAPTRPKAKERAEKGGDHTPGRCYTCGQFDHRAAECPTKGKGKGQDLGWKGQKGTWGTEGCVGQGALCRITTG